MMSNHVKCNKQTIGTMGWKTCLVRSPMWHCISLLTAHLSQLWAPVHCAGVAAPEIGKLTLGIQQGSVDGTGVVSLQVRWPHWSSSYKSGKRPGLWKAWTCRVCVCVSSFIHLWFATKTPTYKNKVCVCVLFGGRQAIRCGVLDVQWQRCLSA